MKELILVLGLLMTMGYANAQTKTAVVDPDVKPVVKTDNRTWMAVEQMPEFPGGEAKLVEWLAKNIRYPKEAKDAGITGIVYVSFVVVADGSIDQVKIIRDIGGGCGAEAARVVKKMPKWKPGLNNGTPVNVEFTLPVSFQLGK